MGFISTEVTSLLPLTKAATTSLPPPDPITSTFGSCIILKGRYCIQVESSCLLCMLPSHDIILVPAPPSIKTFATSPSEALPPSTTSILENEFHCVLTIFDPGLSRRYIGRSLCAVGSVGIAKICVVWLTKISEAANARKTKLTITFLVFLATDENKLAL